MAKSKILRHVNVADVQLRARLRRNKTLIQDALRLTINLPHDRMVKQSQPQPRRGSIATSRDEPCTTSLSLETVTTLSVLKPLIVGSAEAKYSPQHPGPLLTEQRKCEHPTLIWHHM